MRQKDARSFKDEKMSNRRNAVDFRYGECFSRAWLQSPPAAPRGLVSNATSLRRSKVFFCDELAQEQGLFCDELAQEQGLFCDELAQEQGLFCDELAQEQGKRFDTCPPWKAVRLQRKSNCSWHKESIYSCIL
jgi:hypothetical protein